MSIKTFNKYEKGKNERRRKKGRVDGWMEGRKEEKERKKAAVQEFIHTIWNASFLLQLLSILF
jgi:flagellar biosynthesis/type III secretory pathway protein FliH